MQPKTQDEKIYVVLVDDEPRIHEMVKSILMNCESIELHRTFNDPLSFLEYLKQDEEEVDLVLLDVHFETSGLTGIDVLPFIREDFPYLPVVLLTGMEGDEIEEAQDFECTYYIPKPISPESLIRMIQFYHGKAQKSGSRISKLSKDLSEYKELLDILETELESAKIVSQDRSASTLNDKESKPFDRVMEIFLTVLKNSEALPSFIQDLRKIFQSDFKMFKRYVDTIIDFDFKGLSLPGMKIHKCYGMDEVYSLRLSKKVRLFFFQSAVASKRKLLRIDTGHDTKGMDKWLKANYQTFKED